MVNRAKVIKEFELFIKEFHPACTSEGVELDMFREVLALLKEQEPKQVVSIVEFAEGMKVGYCPSCTRSLINLSIDEAKYCKYCGQEVTWNG